MEKPIEINCPKCRTEIPLDDVNPSTDVALCRRCGVTRSFSLLNSAAMIDPGAGPPGTRYERTARGFVAKASVLSWSSAIWGTVTCFFCWTVYGAALGPILRGGKLSAAQLVVIPHMLVGVWLIGATIFQVLGCVRITREDDDLEIFTGIGPVGRRRKLAWSGIRDVHLESRRTGRNNATYIVLDGVNRMSFASSLTEERRRFLLDVIRKEFAGR